MRRLLVALVVLAGLLVVADRVALIVAERRVASRIRTTERLASTPTVEIHGFPFLTQALDGRFTDLEVRARGLRPDTEILGADNVRVDRATARLRGAHLRLTDALRGDVTRLPVDVVDADAVLTYADLSAALPERHLSFSTADGRLRLRGEVTVLGEQYAASGLGSLEASGDRLTVTPQGVEVDAGPVGLAVTPGIVQALSFTVHVQLPFGLRLADVRVAEDGLHLSASGRDVVLRALNRPAPGVVG